MAIKYGLVLIIENLDDQINGLLNTVLMKDLYRKGNSLYVRLGETEVLWSNDFKLIMVSSLENAHFVPEVVVHVTLVNFAVTDKNL